MRSESTGQPHVLADVKEYNETLVQRCAIQASGAVFKLWDSSIKSFWRSTEHRQREKEQPTIAFFPTVSLRCTNALIFIATAAIEWADKKQVRLLRDEIIPSLLTRNPEEFRSTLDTAPNELNVFTLSVYVDTLAKLKKSGLVNDDLQNVVLDRLEDTSCLLCDHPSLNEKTDSSVRKVHPFILYHVSRALRGAAEFVEEDLRDKMLGLLPLIISSVRQAIEEMLSKHMLGSLTPSEAVAMAFCAGALTGSHAREDMSYIINSLRICFETQDATGCWPLGRVVRQNKDIDSDKLEISTPEIAAVIAETLYDIMALSAFESYAHEHARFCEGLQLAAKYSERSIVHLHDGVEPVVGWCTDHAYGRELIESWTSGNVLTFMLRFRRVIEETNRQAILRTFTHVSPDTVDWPSWLRWNNYIENSETDHDHPTLRYIDQKIVQPILNDPRNLPKDEPRNVSALLFGPPGTAKTTLVKGVADGLRWPIVFLSPGNFIERGLEYIEAQAKSVFDRLLKLSRVVVIFDECDELFRERRPQDTTEQTRGITAFVTAAMLPKLQELHDRGRIVFFICTNNLASMDAAVKRGGRIDHIIGIGPPDRKARQNIIQRYVDDRWKSVNNDAVKKEAVRELVGATDRFIRAELLRACELVEAKLHNIDVDRAALVVQKVIELLKPGLTISVDEYNQYIELKKDFSRPVAELRSN